MPRLRPPTQVPPAIVALVEVEVMDFPQRLPEVRTAAAAMTKDKESSKPVKVQLRPTSHLRLKVAAGADAMPLQGRPAKSRAEEVVVVLVPPPPPNRTTAELIVAAPHTCDARHRQQ